MASFRGIRRLRKGEVITAEYLNKLATGAERALIRGPQQIDKDSGTPPEEKGEEEAAEGGAEIERGLVIDATTEPDLWVCLMKGTLIQVAKPPVLRGSGITRIQGGESQIIVPAMVEGLTFIFAANLENSEGAASAINGATGVDNIDWIDLNVDGRMWAEDD